VPLDLAALQRRSARVHLKYADEPFWVDYRPHVIDINALLEMQGKIKGVGDDEAKAAVMLVDILARIVEAWDVTYDGAYLEVTPDTLRTFPFQMLMAILNAVAQDIVDPNRRTQTAAPTPSSSGSPPAALSVLRPTGTAP
jgi:hypothetical protein